MWHTHKTDMKHPRNLTLIPQISDGFGPRADNPFYNDPFSAEFIGLYSQNHHKPICKAPIDDDADSPLVCDFRQKRSKEKVPSQIHHIQRHIPYKAIGSHPHFLLLFIISKYSKNQNPHNESRTVPLWGREVENGSESSAKY